MIQLIVALFILSSSTELFAMSCSDILGQQETSSAIDDVRIVLDQFEFPSEANIKISDPYLRRAIYDAFGGKDVYTGQDISFEDMHIDHFVPSSLGGPDNVYNYVISSSRNNIRKNAAFDPLAAIPMLSYIRTVYAPKVLKLYQAAVAREQARREADRISRERQQSAVVKKPKIQSRGLSQKVVGHGTSFFTANSSEVIESLLVLKEFIDENPEYVNGREFLYQKMSSQNLKKEALILV